MLACIRPARVWILSLLVLSYYIEASAQRTCVVPCVHRLHQYDVVPCSHPCTNGYVVFPCHPQGDAVPCVHPVHPAGDVIYC
jgi:hypothetical protein